MKNAFVRTAVMTLAIAGLAAPSMTAKTASPIKSITPTTSFAGMPTPMCLPSSGQTCGMQ